MTINIIKHRRYAITRESNNGGYVDLVLHSRSSMTPWRHQWDESNKEIVFGSGMMPLTGNGFCSIRETDPEYRELHAWRTDFDSRSRDHRACLSSVRNGICDGKHTHKAVKWMEYKQQIITLSNQTTNQIHAHCMSIWVCVSVVCWVCVGCVCVTVP